MNESLRLKLTCTLGVLMLCGMMAAVSNASVLTNFVSGVNLLEDDDFEAVVIDLAGSPGLLDVGDRVFGVFRVQKVNGIIIGAADPTVTAVFALEVIGKTGPDGAATALEFGPLQSGGANAATTEWAAFVASLGVTTQVPTNDATMTIFFDHPALGLTNEAAGSIGASTDTFDETTATAWLAEFGLGVVTDFWRTTGQAGLDDPANVITLGFAAVNTLQLTALVDNPLDGFEFESVAGVGGFVNPAFQSPGDFGLATDTDLLIVGRLVPEPLSFFVFAGLFGLAAIRSARHRVDHV